MSHQEELLPPAKILEGGERFYRYVMEEVDYETDLELLQGGNKAAIHRCTLEKLTRLHENYETSMDLIPDLNKAGRDEKMKSPELS